MNKLFRLRPPGAKQGQLKIYFILGMIVSVFFSMGFLPEYFNEVRDINRELTRSALMGTEYLGRELSLFSDLVNIKMVMFPLYCVGFLIFVFFNYRYFWQESKSVYVMGRVKSFWELHIRCWAMPLLGMAVVALTGFLIYWLYWRIYVGCAPEGFLSAQEAAFGWRYVP